MSSAAVASPDRSRRARFARAFFATTAGVVWFGLVLQLVIAARNDEARFDGVPSRVLNTLSFFTVQSNVLVAVTTSLLAFGPTRRGRAFAVVRLTALIAITITGVVYHLALADLHELVGGAAVADAILHTASPILAIAGWIAFGPRGRIDAPTIRGALIFPLTWLGYTLVRGALVEDRFGRAYYPYPFLDVGVHGYAVVLVNITLVAALFAVLAFTARWADGRLSRARGRGSLASDPDHELRPTAS